MISDQSLKLPLSFLSLATSLYLRLIIDRLYDYCLPVDVHGCRTALTAAAKERVYVREVDRFNGPVQFALTKDTRKTGITRASSDEVILCEVGGQISGILILIFDLIRGREAKWI